MKSNLVNTLIRITAATVLTIGIANCVLAQAPALSYLEALLEHYADIQLNMGGKEKVAEKEKALALLLEDAVLYRDANPKSVDAWIALGRIRAGYARTQGQVSALALAKEVKTDFEKAIALDPTAQGGFAQGFLGRLYMDLPGWPISIGDNKKGAKLIEEAMAINAKTSANCLFYAQYLISKKEYPQAREYLTKAKEAINADSAHPKWQQYQLSNIAALEKVVAGKL